MNDDGSTDTDAGLCLRTARLRMVPSNVEIARAELARSERFGELLGAAIPASWPPATVADALAWFVERHELAPGDAAWMNWYAIATGSRPEVLIGSIGFFGPPAAGSVEVGYTVLPDFQNRGYATEMVAGLAAWALRQPGVESVLAETDADNAASLRVLKKVGFVEVGRGREPGSLRFELRRDI